MIGRGGGLLWASDKGLMITLVRSNQGLTDRGSVNITSASVV